MSSNMRKVLQCGIVLATGACLGATLFISQPSNVTNTSVVAHAATVKSYHNMLHNLVHLFHKHHTQYHVNTKTYEGRACYIYHLLASHYHLSRKHAAVLTGVAMHETPHITATESQAGGGSGYGIYQVNKPELRRWCSHHHMNYRTLKGQVAQFYNCFVKGSGFRDSKGSIIHEARIAEQRIMRSAITSPSRTASNARTVLKWTK